MKRITNHTIRRLGLGKLMSSPPLRNETGIGLAESLVAIAILGTTMVVIAAGLSTGALAVNTRGEEMAAQSLAQSQLSYTKSYPYNSTAATYPAVDIYDATHNPHPITLPEEYGITLDVSSVAGSDSNIQKITATISRAGQTVLVTEDYKVNR